MCGGTDYRDQCVVNLAGLSPRVRGNPNHIHPIKTWQWTIPACAGEPFGGMIKASAMSDYPRVCGGTALVFIYGMTIKGLSPRVRGNLIS